MLDTSNGAGGASAGLEEIPARADRRETERLAALRRYAILDTLPEAKFDRMTRLAASILDAPIALISLLDEDRQCFKSHHGIALRETAREGSLCAVAIRGDAILEVPDARLDPRFADSPLVTGPPHIRFYAGAPLRTGDGHNIGALAVVDHRPRALSPEQKRSLAELADLVVELIELRSVGLTLRSEIAERERTERALRESEQRVRDFAETASDWFWETDADLRFSYFSERYAHQTGETVTARLGQRRDQVALNDPGDDDWAAHLADIAARRPFRNFVYAYQDRAGVRRFAETSGKPIFDLAGRFCGYRGSARDVTERKRAEEQIRHLAHHDALTGLPNRRLFRDRLEQALALARREGRLVSVMMVDLDGFKEINDTLGHATGDDLLRAVAARVRDTVRASDTVARIGGDEFAVIQSGLATRMVPRYWRTR